MIITEKLLIAYAAILLSLPIARGAAPQAISPLDFESILQNPQGITYGIVGSTIGTDSAGNIYTAGVTQNNSIQPTPGALSFSGLIPFETIFIQKFSPDGSNLLYSAIPAQLPDLFESVPGQIQPTPFGARVDQEGNVYLALLADDVSVAGAPTWTGLTPDGSFFVGVIKIGPQGDRIVYATRAVLEAEPSIAIDLDPTGAVCVGTISALVVNTPLKMAILDPTGALIGQYTITDPNPVQLPTDATLSLAFGPDHSVYAAVGPNRVYRADIPGGNTLFQMALGGFSDQLLANPVFPTIQTGGIVADSGGNSYIAGRAYYAKGSPPFPLTPVDFTQSLTGAWHAFLIKLDPAGNMLFANAFSTENLSAVALDANGNVWAAGGTLTGFTILAIDSAGTLQHYLSLPAVDGPNGSNYVYGLAIDASGRALIAGTTAALVVPDPSSGNHSALNAFFGRLMANPPSADLKVSVSVSPPVLASTDLVTVSITVTNTGSSPAPNVSLKIGGVLSEPLVSGQVNYSPYADSCRTTDNGWCGIEGSQLRLSWQSIGPGVTESAEIQEILSGQTSPYSFSVSALTTADNPDQFNANGFATAGVDSSFMLVVPAGPLAAAFEVEVNDLYFRLDNQIEGQLTGIPVVANTDVTVYIPSPQLVNGQYLTFQGWVDGVTDNPRVFHAGPAVSPALIVHPVLVPPSGPVMNSDDSAVSAASFKTGPVAPGEIIALFGFNLGPSALTTVQLDASGKIATTLSAMQVFFDGTPAPVIYTSAGQSSVVVPYAVEGKPTTNMSIVYNQTSSAVVPIPVSDSAPGLFTANSQGIGQLAALNQDGSFNSRTNPASPGDIVVLYGTGEGSTDSPVDGALGGTVPPKPTLPVSVTIGGTPGEVLYAGGVTGETAGLIQINVRLPATALPGLLPVVLTVGTHSSQAGGTIAVQ